MAERPLPEVAEIAELVVSQPGVGAVVGLPSKRATEATAFAGAYPVTFLWGLLPPVLLHRLRQRDANDPSESEPPVLLVGGAPMLALLASAAAGVLGASLWCDGRALLRAAGALR